MLNIDELCFHANISKNIFSAQLQDVSLREKISHAKLNEILKSVLDSLKGDSTENMAHPFCKYMYDNDMILEDEENNEQHKMMTETISLLESKDCTSVINQCLESSMDFVVESLSDDFLGNEGNNLHFI